MAKKISIAGVVLCDAEGRFLLMQEGLPAAYGLWNLPAGHIDEGETPQKAAVREAYEETGFVVELIEYDPIFVDDATGGKHTKYAFHARITDGQLSIPEDELLDAQWYKYGQITDLFKEGKLRSTWMMTAISKVEDANTRH